MKKLVIIPAYNEERSIIKQCSEVIDTGGYDIIVVNDGSRDATLQLCRENGIKVLDLAVNLGIGGAMQAGYRYALQRGYDIAVQVDGDGQHDPAFLGAMYDALISQNADMVIGSRFIENEGYQSTASRRLGIRYFSGLMGILTGQALTDPTSGFRMVGRELIREFAANYPHDYPEPESAVRLLLQNRKILEIPVKMRERSGGRSSIGLKGSVYYMIKVTLAILLERMRKNEHTS
ncbi:MAG: glycosyltransferase family 2 protein [Lachnospiraceae bacterium]|nr:glycosyltransferase family 2 protein [Lachnospiraceae bacterium]